MLYAVVETPSWNSYIRVFFVGDKPSCENFINEFNEKVYAYLEEEAVKNSQTWLIAMKSASICTWGYHDYEFYIHNHGYGCDRDELEEGIEACINGEKFADYIEQALPNFKVVLVDPDFTSDFSTRKYK